MIMIILIKDDCDSPVSFFLAMPKKLEDNHTKIASNHTGWGPQDSVQLVYKWLNNYGLW